MGDDKLKIRCHRCDSWDAILVLQGDEYFTRCQRCGWTDADDVDDRPGREWWRPNETPTP